MQTILWIHGDNLSPQNPVFQAAPGAPAIFVWDEALLRDWHISLKRIVFMYECLLELPVTIRRGEVAREVVAFAHEHAARRILTADSPAPLHRRLCRQMSQHMPSGSRLEILHETSFVDVPGNIDLKRFSRYWQSVKKRALNP
ncbi:MAG: hypothetical protein MUE40_09525 [Anaerolineae bacterium]|jgi:hypothetical protein|nr:hypothetical protein [Anaerolineae bacterium]